MMTVNRALGEKFTKMLVGENFDKNGSKCQKICYSIQVITDDIEKFVLLLILFGLVGRVKEMLVCMLTIALTRSFLGGMHMKTWVGCTIATLLVYAVAIFWGTYVDTSIYFDIAVFCMEFAFMLALAPLPSPQRPKYSGRKRLCIKVKGLAGVAIMFGGYLYMKSYSSYIVWILLLEIIEATIAMIMSSKNRRRYNRTSVGTA